MNQIDFLKKAKQGDLVRITWRKHKRSMGAWILYESEKNNTFIGTIEGFVSSFTEVKSGLFKQSEFPDQIKIKPIGKISDYNKILLEENAHHVYIEEVDELIHIEDLMEELFDATSN